MVPPLPLWCLAVVLAQEAPTQFTEVVPPVPVGQPLIRSPEQTRAVVVIQGYTVHLTKKGDSSIVWHSYQHADSPLVKLLSQEADVFALAYGETLPVSDYADLPSLRQDIQSVRELGYREIVLIGVSAGGLIARQFVEDLPDSGVTKVIQVDTPNFGTKWAVGKDVFRHSLTKKARQEFLQERRDKRIPDSVQFVCVVGTGLVKSDGLVSIGSQWPEDLQKQGIPARTLHTTHLKASRSQAGVQLIAELVQESLPRWSAMEVAAMRMKLREAIHP
jgi:pimeloyl-ACP methyl ester carboxylesterase